MLAMIVFLVMQAGAGVVVYGIAVALKPELLKEIGRTGDQSVLENAISPTALALAVVISGLLSIGVIALLKMINWKTVFDTKTINWKAGILAIIGAIFGIFVLDILEEMIELPNLLEDQFTGLSNSFIGAISIGLLGPIIEEFIFRESILGYMLRGGVNKWVAIGISSLVFGLVHLNPAQVPFAAAMGVILGIIYYKTGNIVIPSILHILNNSVAVWSMYSMGEEAKELSLTEMLGGTAMAIGITIPVLVVCISLLRKFWMSQQTPQYVIASEEKDVVITEERDNVITTPQENVITTSEENVITTSEENVITTSEEETTTQNNQYETVL